MAKFDLDAFFDGFQSLGNHEINTPFKHKTTDGTRALVLSDIHIPYHNIDGIKKAIKMGKKAKVDVIVLNGDFLDFARVSSYGKNPSMLRFKQELKMGRAFLAMIRENFPDATIYATGGNHQTERIGRYLENNAPELMDLDELRLENLLGYDEFGIVDYDGKLLQFGDAIIMHGDEVRGIGGQMPARKALTKFPNVNCYIGGHLHRGESYFERTYTGQVRHSHVSGHLGEMSPGYMGDCANNWRVGFVIAEIEDGTTNVDHWVKQDNGKWSNVSPVQTNIKYKK